MLKIGDFSKLCRIPVKTLRFYDEIGLLNPALVDQYSGYRYYSAEQLPRLHRILALKDLGFSLEQIRHVLNQGLSAEELRGMLRLRQAEQQHRVSDELARLARVDALLRQIEQEQTMDYQIALKQTTPQLLIGVRDVVPSMAEFSSVYGRLLGELQEYGARHHASWAGPPLLIYLDQEFKEQDIHIEAAFPLSTAISGNARVQIHELPGGEVASLMYQGPYNTMGGAYDAMLRWLGNSGYRIAGLIREIYYNNPAPGSDEQPLTEIQIPVER